MNRLLVGMLAALLVSCTGQRGLQGPQGATGDPGATGDKGDKGDPGTPGTPGQPGADGKPGTNGKDGCDGLAAGQTRGLQASLTLAAPKNGSFFDVGEKLALTISLVDHCGRAFAPTDLGTANLYLSGPRAPLQTRTASRLLNCVTDRNATDHQHHFIDLRSPSFAIPGQSSLVTNADGTLSYTTAALIDEAAGTYTFGLWAKSADQLDQVLALADVQVGTATPETYESGASAIPSCSGCHLGPQSGKSYLAHAFPGSSSPQGDFALDQAPVASCQLCHNLDGFSANPTVRKVHAPHRGARQVTPGVAHPEYTLAEDDSLVAYGDVTFPSMPDADKDCTACHVDDRWKTSPSMLGCGTCHETVFFDQGTIAPPKVLGPCGTGGDCSAFPSTSCDSATGTCQLATHPVQADDSQCAQCHPATAGSGVASIVDVHEILSRTRVRGLQVVEVFVSGGSGTGGQFQLGDVPVLRFKVQDKAGDYVSDLATNPALSASVYVAGPDEGEPQRVWSIDSMTAAGTLTYDASTHEYTYTFPSGFPAQAIAPVNTDPSLFSLTNLPGTYTVWGYVAEAVTVGSATVHDAGSFRALLSYQTGDPARAREVVTNAACNRCHVVLQQHGGVRRDGDSCFVCHTEGALDRGVGAKGIACTTSAQCRAFETCQDTGSGAPDTCVIATDPTPTQTVKSGPMAHAIHLGRLLDGWAERNNAFGGKLTLVGALNTPSDFSLVNLPQDARNCTVCHADTAAPCNASTPCAVGQDCVSGKCANTAWKKPGTAICLSCHDSVEAAGHAALNTWNDGTSAIETCDVCHGPAADFSPDKVHAISAPYVPPYPREKP